MKTLAFRSYVTDGIKAMVENQSSTFGGVAITSRWYDLINDDVEEVDADEIIETVGDHLQELGEN